MVWEEILQELQEKCQYEEERERGRFQWLKEVKKKENMIVLLTLLV